MSYQRDDQRCDVASPLRALPNDAALLVDGFALDGDRYQQVIRGDSKSAAIAAASIIAKTTRDRIMHEYAAINPAYGLLPALRGLHHQRSFGCRRRTRAVADSPPQLQGSLLPAAAVRRSKLKAARTRKLPGGSLPSAPRPRVSSLVQTKILARTPLASH